MSESYEFGCCSAMGVGRSENQDRLVARSLGGGRVLLALADGMGGLAGGGRASETALRFVEDHLLSWKEGAPDLARLLIDTGEEVSSLAVLEPHLEGLGTTLTVAVLFGTDVFWAHVGDSRLYLMREGSLAQISRDHRFLQDLLDSGDVTSEELPFHPLRNVLDQCVGCPSLLPDHGQLSVKADDILMLSSDGLHDHVELEAIRDVLMSVQDLDKACETLISAARRAGSTDDASLVLHRVSLRSCLEASLRRTASL